MASNIDEMNKANIAELFEGKKKHAIGGRVGYNDGQLVTPSVDGSRPGYRGDKTQEVLKAYKEYKKHYYSGKQRTPIIPFRKFYPIYAKENFADGGRIPFGEGKNFEKWIKDQIKNKKTTFRTKGELYNAADVKSSGNNQKILNKYINEFTITSGSRLGGDIATKNTAIKNFFDLQEPGSKINVEKAVKEINKNLPKDQQISESIITNRLKDTKFNTKALGSQTLGQYHGELSDIAKAHIEEAYGDIIDFKKGKYGVSAGGRGESKALYESIRRFVEGGAWDRAYNVGAPDGWILESYKRAGYKPIKQVMPKSKMEKIIGFEAPDGTKWFSSKTNATKYNGKHITTAHPGYDRVNKLVSIVKETRVAPSQAITDLLAKGGVKNIDGLTLERLTAYLLNNDVDIKNIKKGLTTFHKHHVKGVKISPDADIQLVTNVANKEAQKVNVEIAELKKKNLPIDYDTLDKRLKNYGVTIKVDGKRLGGPGFESKADIEKFVTKKIGTWEKSDFEKFAKAAGFNIDKCLSRGGRVKLQGGGGVDTCIRGVLEEEQKKGLKGNKVSLEKFGKFGKLARTAGWFLGPIDIPIELAFALPHMLAGDKEAAKRATTLGLFGYGKDKMDEIKAGSPESYKYLKHLKDNENYINTWFENQDLNEDLVDLKKEQYNIIERPSIPQDRKELALKQRNDLENKIKATEDKMNLILVGYKGYFDEEGKFDVWGEAKGKSALQDYLIKDVTEKTDKGLDMKEYGGHGMNIALGLPWDFAMKPGEVAPFKGGQPITNLKQHIAQRGQPYWKQLKHAAYEAGRPELFNRYFTTADVREPEDAYSDLPIKYASQLGKMEAEETRRMLAEKKAKEEMDEAARKYGPYTRFAGGGIAGIRKPSAIPPESGPQSQGLASLKKYGSYY
jgi:nucleoid DNA-binding protein